uniref:SUN domain-containing protein n=1 Tax=Meleagris gallopavo TaxID=9103 RepID=A0A803Y593_MELGA
MASYRNSPVWRKGKELELNVKSTQLSARRNLILQSVLDIFHENGIHRLKGEEILQLTQHAMEKIMENGIWRPNWALKTMGATVDAERTSESYGGKSWKNHCLPPLLSTAKPPETLLQPDISPGNCWAFPRSQGHVVIRLPEEIQLTALTIWHISRAVSPSGEVSSAPREFAVSGVDEAGGETLLGLFIYDVDGEIAQTFHLQVWRVRAAGCQWGRRKGLPDQPSRHPMAAQGAEQSKAGFCSWQRELCDVPWHKEASPLCVGRRSPAKPSAMSNWRCGATGEMQNTPACIGWKFTATRKRQQKFDRRKT